MLEGLLLALAVLVAIYLLIIFMAYFVFKRILGKPKAYVVYRNDSSNVEEIMMDNHYFGFGGVGDGYCYGHQSFDCLGKLSDREREAISNAEEQVREITE